MDKKLQRRMFLAGIAGSLAAGPFAIVFFSKGRRSLTSHKFEKELRRYNGLVDIPIKSVASVSGPLSFVPHPRIGDKLNYVFFSPSFLPREFSHATSGEPDLFYAREGNLFVAKTATDQTVILGRDLRRNVFYPTVTGERPEKNVAALLKNGRLVCAREKGMSADSFHDIQLPNLLSLQGYPKSNLTVGTKWKSGTGRIKPFSGYQTNYEIVGFAEISGRETVDVGFTADISDFAAMPSVVEKPTNSKVKVQVLQRGNAWFDLETGLLVRQEVSIKSICKGIHEKDSATETKFCLQLFNS